MPVFSFCTELTLHALWMLARNAPPMNHHVPPCTPGSTSVALLSLLSQHVEMVMKKAAKGSNSRQLSETVISRLVEAISNDSHSRDVLAGAKAS